jgi:ubiquinone/menaquinone biosynthesis C-methylase UbiE
MDYEVVAANIRASYREVSPKYRSDDEVEVTTENHRHLSRILNEISSSFQRPIAVLDAGCGTGRYFHCLQNVEQLVGIDVSPEMLKAAEFPVREQQVTARKIELICENVYLASFPPASFDFVYSLGMFGNGCPVTLQMLNRFHEWLRPGGRLFFNAVDVATIPFKYRVRKRLRRLVYPILPQSLKTTLDERQRWLPFFGMTRKELQKLMRETRFGQYAVSSHVCNSPLWRGVLLECSATKE